MSQERFKEEFKSITNNIMKKYYSEVNNFINVYREDKLSSADMIVMIMNITVNVSVNIFLSFKSFFPNQEMDYEFMRATIINNISDDFKKITTFDPIGAVIKLTHEQSKEILEKGSITLKMDDGTEMEFTEKDLLIEKESVDELIKEVKAQSSYKKIIIPH